jgi:hypothetical protein
MHGTPGSLPLVPAEAGTQGPHDAGPWIPACAGMSGEWGRPSIAYGASPGKPFRSQRIPARVRGL